MTTQLTKVIGNFQTTLAANISAGGTTGTLSSASDKEGNALPSGKYCMVVNQGQSNEQHMIFDLSGVSMTNIVGVDHSGDVVVGALKDARINNPIKLTDFVNLLRIVDILNGISTLDGSSPMKYDAEPSFSDRKQVITKGYADDILSGLIGTATDIAAGTNKMTKNQGSKPRAQSTYVREQDTPDMTLKVESFRGAFIDKIINFAGGNSPTFIDPGFGGDITIPTNNPSNGETVTLTINGTACVFTFVSSIGSTPGNVLIGGTQTITRANLAALINAPGVTTANGVAFTGAQLIAMGLVNCTDDLSTNIFVRATSSTVTTFAMAETMAGAGNVVAVNTTKNRLDLLVLDNGGSLAIRKGTEAVSPVASTPTTGDTVLCSVYNIPGETSIKDRTAALSGYITEWYDLAVYRSDLITASSLKFGGDGSSGALNITSGTTNIDVGGARIYVLNYTTLSITGTGALTFSNPHANGTFIIIKVQGNVTLTSSATPMIDASGMGAKGGASQVVGASANVAGLAGNIGTGFLYKVGGGGAAGAAPGPVGAAGATVSAVTTYEQIDSFIASKYSRIVPGSGGGTGASNTSAGGSAVLAAGGNGGGALVIECAGTWTFTTTNGISVAGKTPATSTSSGGNSTAGGAAAGSGGYFLGLYNILGLNTGTVNILGGTGGIGTNTSGSTHYGGGSGGNLLGAGVAGTSSATSGVKTGADGVVGYSAIIKNTELV